MEFVFLILVRMDWTDRHLERISTATKGKIITKQPNQNKNGEIKPDRSQTPPQDRPLRSAGRNFAFLLKVPLFFFFFFSLF